VKWSGVECNQENINYLTKQLPNNTPTTPQQHPNNNTPTTTLGFDSSDQLLCEFGSNAHRVSAKILSPNLATCSSPSHLPGPATLQISSNGQQFTPTDIEDEFYYSVGVSLLSIAPILGSTDGSTRVTISGTNFDDSPRSKLMCKFGSNSVPATFVSNTELTCLSPSRVTDGTSTDTNKISVVVSVSNNGVDFEGESENLLFNYISAPSVASVSPLTSPNLGETVLTVSGSGFHASPSTTALCKFEQLGGGGDDNDETIYTSVAQVVNSGSILCPAPELGNLVGRKIFAVQVSTNGGADYTTDTLARITYHVPLAVTSIYPSSGPESGSTKLYISGENFFRSTHLKCAFSINVGVDVHKTFVPATYISATMVSCKSQGSSPGVYNVQISTNDQR